MKEAHQPVSGVREGDVIAGKYRIDRVLGVGGMGVVVAAHHVQLDSRVAIKFLSPNALSDQHAVARFAQEARAAVRIQSEHVARVSDVGNLENGAPYMVMEYLEGSDLSGWIQQHGALPVEQGVEFVLQACEAIAEAHVLGIVHRDLKPANLFVIRRPDGALSVKVLDFGISKSTELDDSSARMTSTRAVMGSPFYMSPEQLQSPKNVDARTDIWALGVILYELLSAQMPFKADTMPELILKIVSDAPIPLPGGAVPDRLEAVIVKCLQKDREKRFATVGELASALHEFAPKRARVSVERISGVMKAAGLSMTSTALPPSSDAKRAPAVDTAASWGRTTVPRSHGAWLVVGGIVVLAATGAMFAVMRKPPAAGEVSTAALRPPDAPRSAAPPAAPALDSTVTPPAVEPVETAAAATPVTPPSQSSTTRDEKEKIAPDVKPTAAGHSKHRPPTGAATATAGGAPPSTAATAAIAPPSPAAPAATPPPSSPNCSPNFYFDNHGTKHFKPECF